MSAQVAQLMDAQMLRPRPGSCIALLAQDGARRAVFLAELACVQRHSVLVTQDDALFRRLDLAGNLRFGFAARGLTRREARRQTGELLALAGLEAEAARRPDRADAEARAATLVARGAAAARAVLLLDDPFHAIDGPARVRLQSLVRRLATQRAIGILIATPRRSEALALGDQVGVLARDGVARLGAVADIFAHPVSAEEAAWLCEANLLTGRVEAVDPDDDREAEIRLACGRVMQARQEHGLGAGALCQVAVRPDRVAFAAIDADEMGQGALPATLVDHRNLGDHVRMRLRLEDGTMIHVRRPAASLTMRDLERAARPLGAALAWRAAHATAFPHPET